MPANDHHPNGLLQESAPGLQHDDMENQQQQVCWERFLLKDTLNVLLVESDASTRQVVSALLRCCMYQVISAKNGQQAWAYLEDKGNNIDLVLTEVFMPGVSGISLLSRIMRHNIFKNIPVIMMSSSDDMSTVFKCLSKGAVDFLVKPIRKNELKNLWQHVWRQRCHSSSGSGSESGIQTQKCAKSKGVNESGNNSGSNDDEAGMGLNARDDSDNGSGTQDLNDLVGLGGVQRMAQNSWTKLAVEIDSPQATSLDQLADPPNSTCAQVIHSKSEICSNRWLPDKSNRNCKKPKNTNDDFKGKDLEIGGPENLYMGHQSSPNGRSIKAADHENNSKESMMENLEEPTVRAADLIGSMAKNMDTPQAARAAEDTPNFSSKVPEGKGKNNQNDKYVLPSLELSLKRSRSCGDGANNKNTVKDDEQRNCVLRRSNLSAFTRYHTSAASNQGGTGLVGSCSPHDNSSEAVKTDSTYNMKSNSDAAPIKQGSNGSSNDNDMGSTTKDVVTKPMLPSAIKANGYTSAFHPVQQWMVPANATAGKTKADENTARNHCVHFENGGSGALQCGSSNVFDPPLEGQATNNYGGVKAGSNSGSNKGQNNGSTAAANAGLAETEIQAMDKSGVGGGNGNGNGSGSGSGNDTYVRRLAANMTPRQAQLKKYREKKKDRNFGKKVRYQSRKRLADQRPRVRGQFVKQAVQNQDGARER
ncbi:two-component response regulator-like PRR37 isoform X2 [Zea mays]|uniref:two-component response regulator-like PRR37 isoform X2 n=1 Tax=Zea mays TaxID=4577 RepID=UPI0004DEC2C4|nr:two-component response regulator-like PRR37 isoform X2 [Zea mays]|eukprot:XP_008670693.1 two-component response regulator-like PRR37 isoform X2 [Zea mays]